jgi:hypothetical protein
MRDQGTRVDTTPMTMRDWMVLARLAARRDRFVAECVRAETRTNHDPGDEDRS